MIETWLPEARAIAAQCWCDMSPELAEVIAYKIAAWMETGAFHARNEEYWRDRAQQAEGVRTWNRGWPSNPDSICVKPEPERMP